MDESLFDLITRERILAELSATNKKEVLEELAAGLNSTGLPENVQEIYGVLLERESLGSTGIGEGIAIPHGKLKGLKKIKICFGRSSKGVPFEAIDGRPVHLFFLMLAPESSAGLYLKTLARLSRFLKIEKNRAQLLNASTIDEIVAVLSRAE